MKKVILIITLIVFLIITIIAVFQHGYIGIFTAQFKNYAGIQVIFDLFIALSLFLFWMYDDAKKSNRNPIPWILLVLSTGSIGALIYLILYKTDKTIK